MITVSKAPTNFTPVSVTITAETQEQLDYLGKLFNWAPFSGVLEDMELQPRFIGFGAPYTLLAQMGAKVSPVAPVEDLFAAHGLRR